MSAFDSPLAQGQEAGLIALSIGHPAPALLPAAALRAACLALGEDLRKAPATLSALQYGQEAGAPSLRAALRAQLAAWEGLRIPEEQLMVIGGATQGVSLAATLFASAERGVLVEAPTYKDALLIFRDLERPLHPIPMTEEGIDTDALASVCARLAAAGRPPALLYTIPTFHNPTGVTASTPRRRAVLALSARYGFRIVEDEVYRELAYDDSVPPSYYELAASAAASAAGPGVLRLGSFSKTLAPGLRLGWLMGTAADLKRCQASGVWEMGGGANPFVAEVLARLLAADGWARHIDRLRDGYRARRAAMLSALEELMPPGSHWTRPAGGFFLWLRLPSGIRAASLLAETRARGMSFTPGADFYVEAPTAADELRLCFSNASEEEIARGVAILAEGLAALR